MLTKCANPSCSASFRFLHSGKLFHFDKPFRPSVGHQIHRPASSGEMFWLCEKCAFENTLVIDTERHVHVVPLPRVPRDKPYSPPERRAAAV